MIQYELLIKREIKYQPLQVFVLTHSEKIWHGLNLAQ